MSTRLAVVALAVAVLVSGCALAISHRPPDNPNLHHVKRVFVLSDEKRRADFLAEALTSRGFVIVGTESDADAAITLESLEEIAVDAPPPRPNFGWAADLRSPTLGVHWRTAINSVVHETHPDAVRRNMETIAERLFKAWKESAVRAGDLTPAQAKALKRIR